MKTQLEFFAWTRKNLIELLRSITPHQARKIPPGFNNNLLWNAGHVYWVQQMLVYHFAGLPIHMPEGFDKAFATGTLPQNPKNGSSGLPEVIQLLEEGVARTTEDFKEGKFVNYTPLQSSYDNVEYTFTEWEQAFQYNNIHEARHYGYMVGLRQCL